ncbi:hypothetical protein PTSG_02985 [Salpingoeca rosetta]|uniref:FHA domain-containing protein n=1 Tax=Salpingoeca rosetta (strain ATCC 50818 / BSB-021) TaxID=946362 RepID=F2U3X6_SALR5|nr:uncharacterized protein PTSG_02985 [Salpingoeca rosetta]EGD82320.1 hypothetical protein PTSG_02985 [Salpingoeca rosetta]|eukprot:XP_004996503.1 hypothetical protein PTSG_02985 [Salpingoeca rosetta]
MFNLLTWVLSCGGFNNCLGMISHLHSRPVGFDDTCDINLAKYVIIDTPIAQNTHALLTFDPALRQHTLFAPPSATSTTAPPSSTPSTTPPVAERIMVRCGPRKSFEPIPTTGHALASGDIIAVAGVCFVYTTPAAPA